MTAIEILQNHNLKKTTPRVAIINALQSCNFPLSETEVKEKLGDLYDRITFYRSVQSLMGVGIIHRIVIDNTTIKYALNKCTVVHNHQIDHIHFFCNNCKSLICLHDIKTLRYDLPNGFNRNECEVIIKGLCDKCNS